MVVSLPLGSLRFSSEKGRIVIRITNIVNKFEFPNFVQKFLIISAPVIVSNEAEKGVEWIFLIVVKQ